MSLITSRDELFAFAEREREPYEDLLKAFVEVPTASSEPDRQQYGPPCSVTLQECLSACQGLSVQS